MEAILSLTLVIIIKWILTAFKNGFTLNSTWLFEIYSWQNALPDKGSMPRKLIQIKAYARCIVRQVYTDVIQII